MAQTQIQSQNQSQQEQTTRISELTVISDRLLQIAQQYQNDPSHLLEILRAIESVHKQIRDDLFQPALPTSRHELFNLLRDIEANGGWPHIYRMKIHEICEYLNQPEELEE